MNVFVLCTGRCGSTTFIHACEHIKNFTAAHESNRNYLGEARLRYPTNHIESDNRLSWLLGRLDQMYGDQAFYVHLTRDREPTARSYARRDHSKNIITAYRTGILMGCPSYIKPIDVCLDFYDTVNSNIACFLKDKTHKMNFRLENAKEDFEAFWNFIGAEGDLSAALSEWEKSHNATGEEHHSTYLNKTKKKFNKQIRKLQYYWKLSRKGGRTL